MQMTPYLFFDGTCRDAFTVYAEVLGGRITMMVTAAETPMAAQVPPEAGNRIMHARLEAAGAVLMASDGMMGAPDKPSGMRVSLTVDDVAEAERIYAALSEGATIDVPLQQTFWSQRFAMLTDRFGTPWMINCD